MIGYHYHIIRTIISSMTMYLSHLCEIINIIIEIYMYIYMQIFGNDLNKRKIINKVGLAQW